MSPEGAFQFSDPSVLGATTGRTTQNCGSPGGLLKSVQEHLLRAASANRLYQQTISFDFDEMGQMTCDQSNLHGKKTDLIASSMR